MAANTPELTEQFQKDLEKFLVQVPALSGLKGPDIISGTPHLQTPFKREALNAIRSQIRTDSRFQIYTGYSHETLLESWLTTRETTCNSFCQQCANAMGYKTFTLGRFDIADQLNGRGLSHCWITPDSGAAPQYGDLFRLYDPEPDHNGMSLNHMGVSFYLDGSNWYTVESGQGGPSKGYDAICRRIRPWPTRGLKGWVSMRALINAEKPLPFWLGGWWQVDEDPYDTWFYHFAAGGKVTCTTHRPQSITAPPMPASLVGTFAVKGMFEVEISWNSDDVSERLTVYQGTDPRKAVIKGKTARGATLDGKRLMPANAFV